MTELSTICLQLFLLHTGQGVVPDETIAAETMTQGRTHHLPRLLFVISSEESTTRLSKIRDMAWWYPRSVSQLTAAMDDSDFAEECIDTDPRGVRFIAKDSHMELVLSRPTSIRKEHFLSSGRV
jgi:hypothetical protein